MAAWMVTNRRQRHDRLCFGACVVRFLVRFPGKWARGRSERDGLLHVLPLHFSWAERMANPLRTLVNSLPLYRPSERGQALPGFVVLIPVFILSLFIVLDLGRYQIMRNQVRIVADFGSARCGRCA